MEAEKRSETCPQCGRPKKAYNATCTASRCQEAEYYANRERNALARRRKKKTA